MAEEESKSLNTSTANDTTTSYDPQVTDATNSLNSISVPSRTFENITDLNTGVLFSLYNTSILFPLRIDQPENNNDTYKIIGSSVLSAIVAEQKISGLMELVNITLAVTVTVSVHYYVTPIHLELIAVAICIHYEYLYIGKCF